MRSLLARLTPLHSPQKMLTNREMVNFQKWDFVVFVFTFTINCVATGARKMPVEYIFCFICSKQSIKIIPSR